MLILYMDIQPKAGNLNASSKGGWMASFQPHSWLVAAFKFPAFGWKSMYKISAKLSPVLFQPASQLRCLYLL